METIKKQASRLREQMAKQHAVLRQFTMRYSQDPALIDEAELQCHQNLQKLYNSTKAAKHLQRNIVRGVESFIAISTKQMEILKRLADDCCKYGSDNQSSNFALAKASVDFGTSHKLIEKENENLLKILADQVFAPLREMIMSAPLEDARLLTYRYERIRQDVESQIAEVMKRQMKSKEAGSNDDSTSKLKNAEFKLTELQTTLSALGKEATAAMLAVEAQQQKVTYERLLAMVDAEKAYHQSAASILDKLHDEMILAKEQSDSLAQSEAIEINSQTKSITQGPEPMKSIQNNENGQANEGYVAEVIHPFDAQADGELSISVGDTIVVRQVSTNGWSQGECQGRTGWFPSAYVQRRAEIPAGKVIDSTMLT
ncbi:SH3 domain-containing protein [Rhynchospora pubera]|uniref:SH3 domain-containing protein n=1 Tax=Rhynchospora pubera TaxID=906938 RepID=A0AAV8EIN5_9POAL|nr:SH3 domain-containing protein [Rhynchospora pubera]